MKPYYLTPTLHIPITIAAARLVPDYAKKQEREFKNNQRKQNYEKSITTRPVGRCNKLRNRTKV